MMLIEVCLATLLMGTSTAIETPSGDGATLDEQTRATVRRSLPYIEEKGVWWMEEKKCVTCHRIGPMVWSLSAARERGLPVSDRLDEWLDWPQMAAVKNGHLYSIPPDLIQRHTPRLLIGARRLCQHLDQARLSASSFPAGD